MVFKMRIARVNGLVNINQVFDPTSTDPQSGIAVDEAMAKAPGLVKTFCNMYDAGQTSFTIDLAKDETKQYVVYAITVTTVTGEIILCDTEVSDYMTGGSTGLCHVDVKFAEAMDLPIIIKILYSEEG